MKLVFVFAAAISALMVLAVYDLGTARRVITPAPSLFQCRVPGAEGEITVITIGVRRGELVGSCEYAATRASKPKKGG